MSKIVLAVNSMITNSKEISDVSNIGSEYYFLYKKKYKWSIYKGDDEYNDDYYYALTYYAGKETIDTLLKWKREASHDYWKAYPQIIYSTATLKTTETMESFAELYNIISEKSFDVDIVLDDIINPIDEIDVPF